MTMAGGMAVSDSGLEKQAEFFSSDVFLQGWRGDEDEEVDIDSSSDENSQGASNAAGGLVEFGDGIDFVEAKHSLTCSSPTLSAGSLHAKPQHLQDTMEEDARHHIQLHQSSITTRADAPHQHLLKPIAEESDDETASSPLKNLGLPGSPMEPKEKRSREGKRLGAREFRNAFNARVNASHTNAVSLISDKGILTESMCQGHNERPLYPGFSKPTGTTNLNCGKEASLWNDSEGDMGNLDSRRCSSIEIHTVDGTGEGAKDCPKDRKIKIFQRRRRNPAGVVHQIGQDARKRKDAEASDLSTAEKTSETETFTLSPKPYGIGEKESPGFSKRVRRDQNIQKDANLQITLQESLVSSLNQDNIAEVQCAENCLEKRCDENEKFSIQHLEKAKLHDGKENSCSCDKGTETNCAITKSLKEIQCCEFQLKDNENIRERCTEKMDADACNNTTTAVQRYLRKNKLRKYVNLMYRKVNRLSMQKLKILRRSKKRVQAKCKQVCVNGKKEITDKRKSFMEEANTGSSLDDENAIDGDDKDQEKDDRIEEGEFANLFESGSDVSREGNDVHNSLKAGDSTEGAEQAEFFKVTYNDRRQEEGETETSVTITRQPIAGHCNDLSCGGETDCNDDMNILEDCSSTDYHNSICEKCGLEGDLICCDGKGCKITYHLSCLDPPLTEVPPGDWYCPDCTYKQASFKGIESIWDVKEARSSEDTRGLDANGMVMEALQRNGDATSFKLDCFRKKHECNVTEKLYFVKYKGVSHIHNKWVPETQLMKEAPKLLANFKKRFEQREALKWNSEWTEPCRIVGKKVAASPKGADGCVGSTGFLSSQCVEWCIKWKGLGYEQCTWESENLAALTTTEAQGLIKEYEERCKQARERAQHGKDNERSMPVVGFSKLAMQPYWLRGGKLYPHQLEQLNALRKFWHCNVNGIVVDTMNKDRIVTAISFLLSLLKEFEVVNPVLVVIPQTMLGNWEVQLCRWASGINIVFYNGIKEARESIQRYEFYTTDGYFLPQIVVTSFDVVTMDFELFKGLKWEALVVDESQRLKSTKTSRFLSQLHCDYRLLLFNEPIKDNADDHIQFLSLLQDTPEVLEHDAVHAEPQEETRLAPDKKSRISRHIVYEKKPDSLGATFLKEFWVPVEMTALQVTEYCKLLIEKHDMLIFRHRSLNAASVLQELLLKLRECCNHPFLVNPKLQESRTDLTQKGLLELGIKASGKLWLLDRILSIAKSEGHRVVILTQMHLRSGKITQMDILDDYMRQQFGVNSYERVDGGLAMNKKQAAVQRFNRKDSTCFVFLLDKRACGPAIKLVSVNFIIIFDSDWNPQNDIQNFQKVRFDQEADDIKVYRLYCPHSIEERALISSRRNSELDTHYENYTLAVCQRLLRWGAAENLMLYDQLSRKEGNDSISDRVIYNKSNLKLLLGKASFVDSDIDALQSSYWKTALELREAGNYGRGGPLYAEADSKLAEEDEIQASEFWSKMLKDRYLEPQEGPGRGLRARKKVQYDENMLLHKCADVGTVGASSIDGPDNEDETRRKRRKVLDTVASMQISPGAKDVSAKSSEQNGKNAQHCGNPEVHNSANRKSVDTATLEESTELVSSKGSFRNDASNEPCIHAGRDQQQLFRVMNLHLLKLGKALQLQEDVVKRAEQLLQFLVRNFKLPKHSASLLHAVELSLCWLAAEQQHYCIDHTKTLALAESCFGVQLRHVDSVYAKLEKQFKENFSADQSTFQYFPLHSSGKGHQNCENVLSIASWKLNKQRNQVTSVGPGKEVSEVHIDPNQQRPTNRENQGTSDQVNSPIEVSRDSQMCAAATEVHSRDNLQGTSFSSGSTLEPVYEIPLPQEGSSNHNQESDSLPATNAESSLQFKSVCQGMSSQVLISANTIPESDGGSGRSSSQNNLNVARNLALFSQPSMLVGPVEPTSSLPEPLQQQQCPTQLPRLDQEAILQSGSVVSEQDNVQQVSTLISNYEASNRQSPAPQQQQNLLYEQVQSTLPTSSAHFPNWQQRSSLQIEFGNLGHPGISPSLPLDRSFPTLNGASSASSVVARGSTYPNSARISTPGTSQIPLVRIAHNQVYDPLSQEYLRLRKEQERMKALHEAEKERLKTEYAKEQEALRRRFDNLFQEEERRYSHKLVTLEGNLKRVEMNRRLAEAFRLKATDDDAIINSSGFSSGIDAASAPDIHSSRLHPWQQQILPSTPRASLLARSRLVSPISSDLSRSCSLSGSVAAVAAGSLGTAPAYGQLQQRGIRLPATSSNIGSEIASAQCRAQLQASNFVVRLRQQPQNGDGLYTRPMLQLTSPCTEVQNRTSPCMSPVMTNLSVSRQQHQGRAISGFPDSFSVRDNMPDPVQNPTVSDRTGVYPITIHKTTVCQSNCSVAVTSSDVSGFRTTTNLQEVLVSPQNSSLPDNSTLCTDFYVGSPANNLPANRVADLPFELCLPSEEMQASVDEEPLSVYPAALLSHCEGLASAVYPEIVVEQDVPLSQGNTENALGSNARFIYLSDDD